MNRRRFLAASLGTLLPLPVSAQSATIHELSGEVRIDGYRMARNSAVFPGQTIDTGADGQIWFTVGGDAYFLRPGSRLKLISNQARGTLVDVLRLVTGALGATFLPGRQRMVVASTATIGIRGTGVYVEANREETYACTCFGSTEMISTASGTMMESVIVAAENHQARRLLRDPQIGMRVQRAAFERHTSAEIARLESLAGRPNPFRT